MDEYELEELTEDSIVKAEELLGVQLPNSYIKLMKQQNGGRLFTNSFPFKEIGEGRIQVDHILGIGSREEGILITKYMIKEWGLPNDIVLISGDGHSWIVLDYRQRQKESIVSYIDTEENLDIKLANNFSDFLEQLIRDEDFVDSNELIPENKYTPMQLETEVQKGNNPFLITDGFLYFSGVECDVNWLISQAIIVTENPDKFIIQEVMAYIMKKIASVDNETLDKDTLITLADRMKEHDIYGVRKYYKKLKNFID